MDCIRSDNIASIFLSFTTNDHMCEDIHTYKKRNRSTLLAFGEDCNGSKLRLWSLNEQKDYVLFPITFNIWIVNRNYNLRNWAIVQPCKPVLRIDITQKEKALLCFLRQVCILDVIQ